ncbi:Carboxylesterase type B [Neofusicoccum parvum]|uniref:Carboxylic ester hydrolase n=1 Tax=Botryosphaeria parva (strain UCR-NP2) TaxID=1287680 RepID=R1EPH8_BOTPV|nr:putative triacylglycerol lipase protein [Neofusicoccum parvum UCRNP2]GME64118.1 Carboxylesterase type B [Neofusicoccum parvum]
MHASLASLALLVLGARAVDPLVQLDYASYRGTPLAVGVTQWMGLPYAAPPVGDLRFAAPRDIAVENKEYEANSHGPSCIGVDSAPGNARVSEDCLKLDVYAPSAAAADAALPVYFYVQGGGFSGSAQPPNGSTLVETSGGNMVVVTFTYRVGPYGFLGGVVPKPNMSPMSAPDFSVNNGLKDQLKALQWVKTHIASFGGNPNHIVLGGASAGAGAVVIHMANPVNNGSFIGATLESAAWPPLHTAEEAQYEYDNILNLTGCAGEWDTLACIRNIDTKTFQTKTRSKTKPLPGANAAPVYMYGPVLDGDLVREFTYSSFFANHENEVPILVGDTTNEGIVFTPASAGASLAAADDFVNNQFPTLSNENLTFFHSHPQYKPLIDASNFRGFAAQLYGDMRYVCPNLFLSWTLPSRAQNNNIWTYHWDVGAATHISESASVWNGFTGNNATMAPLQQAIHAYWVSFITRLDPNAGAAEAAAKEKNAAAPLSWERSASAQQQWAANRILFSDKTATPLAPRMESVDQDQWDACVELMDLGVQLMQ